MSKQQIRQKLYDEFDYKDKAGTAWSHNYLNQKPWHPLSYPNQRRKWIAEQMQGMGDKRKQEVEKEFAKEQDMLKQSALLSKKQRAKVQAMQSVSFLYTKPPGYNAESARAAEMADQERQQQPQLRIEGVGLEDDAEGRHPGTAHDPDQADPSGAVLQDSRNSSGGNREGAGGEGGVDEALVLAKSGPLGGQSSVDTSDKKKRKAVPRDVFGNKIATEEDFEVLKNAPRIETGILGRAKPFGVEIRNVKCGRCGAVGHQSGDRECPMRDAVTEADMKKKQMEDPLSLILVHNRSQDLPWESKLQAGSISPPRGGFRLDDANQQILPPIEDDLEDAGPVDQYGGFLGGGDGEFDPIMAGVSQVVLSSLSKKQRKELKRALKEKEREERRERKRKRESERERRRKRKGKGEGEKRHKGNRNGSEDSLSLSSASTSSLEGKGKRREKKNGRKTEDNGGDSSEHEEKRQGKRKKKEARR